MSMVELTEQHIFFNVSLIFLVNLQKEPNKDSHKCMQFLFSPYYHSKYSIWGLNTDPWSHTAELSSVEQEHSCLGDRLTVAPTPMGSISIPVKGREIPTLPGIALREVSSSTNAVLGTQRRNTGRDLIGCGRQQALNGQFPWNLCSESTSLYSLHHIQLVRTQDLFLTSFELFKTQNKNVVYLLER